MRNWRNPFGQPPESAYILFGVETGKNRLCDRVDWLLPRLNWRSHIYLVGLHHTNLVETVGTILDIAAAFLNRHEYACVFVHPEISFGGEIGVREDEWAEMIAPVKPFQEQAHKLMSEARLHFAPILSPVGIATQVEADAAAAFFRNRMAIPSFCLPAGTLAGLPEEMEGTDARFFVDDGDRQLGNLLWDAHVFESVLESVEEERRPYLSPCRRHTVIEADGCSAYSCFYLHSLKSDGVPIHHAQESDLGLPGPPDGSHCLDCIGRSAAEIRENLVRNRRESEGRRVYFELSKELASRGSYDSAGALARSAYDISNSDEDRTASLIQQALCLRDSRKLDEADAVLLEASAFTSDSGLIAYQRGRVQYVWRDYIEALDRYEEALQTDSKHVPFEDMCFEMALCHINIEEYAEARPYLEKSQKSGQENPPIAFYRGVCDYGEGNPELALEHFRRALSLGPDIEDLGRVLFYIGSCLKELELFEEAVDTLKQAVEADPDDIANHNLLGFCYYKLKRHEEAIACFLRAVEINPQSGIDWANLGSNLRDLGRTDDAIIMYKKALSLDPHIGFARENLATLSKRKG